MDPQPNTPQPITPPSPASPTPRHSGGSRPDRDLSRIGFIMPLLSFILLLLLISTAYLAYQNMQLQKQVADFELGAYAMPTPTPEPIPDPTANWKTYTNNIQKYSFKYPPSWQINTTTANEQENSVLELTRDQAKLTIYANMVGIGGSGREYQGTRIMLDGIPLYKYKEINTYAKTWVTGVTDALTKSLGVFQYNGKTYQIIFTYPTSYDQAGTSDGLQKEFDHILSSFTFL